MRHMQTRWIAMVSLIAFCAQSLGLLSAAHHATCCDHHNEHVVSAGPSLNDAASVPAGHDESHCAVCQAIVAGKVFAENLAEVAVTHVGYGERIALSENHPTISGANESISLRGPPIA